MEISALCYEAVVSSLAVEFAALPFPRQDRMTWDVYWEKRKDLAETFVRAMSEKFLNNLVIQESIFTASAAPQYLRDKLQEQLHHLQPSDLVALKQDHVRHLFEEFVRDLVLWSRNQLKEFTERQYRSALRAQ